MRHALVVFGLLAALLMMAGCVDGTQKVTLNPDGSGKCEVDVFVTMIPGLVPLEPGMSAQDQATKMIRQMVEESMKPDSHSGISAWSNMSYDVGKDERIHFKGTFYFKNIAEIDLPFKLSWTKTPPGVMTLSLKMDEGEGPASQPAASQPSEEEIKKRIAEVRQGWANIRPMAAMVGALMVHVTFVLPGKVDKTTVFEKKADGVGFTIDGKKMLDAADKLYKDDAALAELVKSGGGNTAAEEFFSAVLFGKEKKVSAVVSGEMKPLFDYKTEFEAAAKAQPLMLKKLGLGDDSTPMPKLDAPLAPTTAP